MIKTNFYVKNGLKEAYVNPINRQCFCSVEEPVCVWVLQMTTLNLILKDRENVVINVPAYDLKYAWLN